MSLVCSERTYFFNFVATHYSNYVGCLKYILEP
jgi:hypothetical protein